MKKVLLMAATIAVSGMLTELSAQTTGDSSSGNGNGNNHDLYHHKPHRCAQQNNTPKVSYNSATTVLNVSFPGNWQGGKVEIHRNGTLVVDVKAPAGTTLCYMLRNYGKGNYTVIVSSGNTVVYYGNYVVK